MWFGKQYYPQIKKKCSPGKFCDLSMATKQTDTYFNEKSNAFASR